VQAKTLTIGSDLSGSNPLLKDKTFNGMAAKYVYDKIIKLQKGDTVVMQSFGSVTATANIKEFRYKISRNNQKKVANTTAKNLINLPSKAEPQQQTNILSWLEINAFDCEDNSEIVVLTDGIEMSNDVDGNKLLDGGIKLPKPDEFTALNGCKVIFYGMGVGRIPTEKKNLRRAWNGYFKQAKVASFKAVMK
jgi:hypothetical protein